MRLKEALGESYYDSFYAAGGRGETPIFKDPSISELNKILRVNDVRGLLWKGHLYIWNADVLHVEIVKKMQETDPSISYRGVITITFFKDPYTFGIQNRQDAQKFKFKNPALERLMDNFPNAQVRMARAASDLLIWPKGIEGPNRHAF